MSNAPNSNDPKSKLKFSAWVSAIGATITVVAAVGGSLYTKKTFDVAAAASAAEQQRYEALVEWQNSPLLLFDSGSPKEPVLRNFGQGPALYIRVTCGGPVAALTPTVEHLMPGQSTSIPNIGADMREGILIGTAIIECTNNEGMTLTSKQGYFYETGDDGVGVWKFDKPRVEFQFGSEYDTRFRRN